MYSHLIHTDSGCPIGCGMLIAMQTVNIELDEGLAAIVRDYAESLGVTQEKLIADCVLSELGVKDEQADLGNPDDLVEGY